MTLFAENAKDNKCICESFIEKNKRVFNLEKEKCELLGIIQGKDKAIKDLHDKYEQYKAVAEPEIAALKTTILKLRNCMNCKHRDTKGHSSCKDKGIVLCSHWEMKE